MNEKKSDRKHIAIFLEKNQNGKNNLSLASVINKSYQSSFISTCVVRNSPFEMMEI